MAISIIIPCYLLPDKNSELLTFTGNCISSIRKYLNNYELILVDNGSPIGQDYLMSQADVYIRNKENLGFAPAVNQGLKIAKNEWLVACNNDIEFINDWVATAIDTWENNIGAISSHLHDNDPHHRVGRENGKIGNMFGALWLTHQSVVKKVGYLDEGYERGMFEDKDYWQRLLKSGYKLAKVGHCLHVGNATWGKLPHQHEIYVQNMERYKQKWNTS